VSTHSGTHHHTPVLPLLCCLFQQSRSSDGQTAVLPATLSTELSLRPLVTEFTRTLTCRHILCQHITCIFSTHAKHKPSEPITKLQQCRNTNDYDKRPITQRDRQRYPLVIIQQHSFFRGIAFFRNVRVYLSLPHEDAIWGAHCEEYDDGHRPGCTVLCAGTKLPTVEKFYLEADSPEVPVSCKTLTEMPNAITSPSI